MLDGLKQPIFILCTVVDLEHFIQIVASEININCAMMPFTFLNAVDVGYGCNLYRITFELHPLNISGRYDGIKVARCCTVPRE